MNKSIEESLRLARVKIKRLYQIRYETNIFLKNGLENDRQGQPSLQNS